MRKFFLNILIALTSFSFFSFAHAEDQLSNQTELNLFTYPAIKGLSLTHFFINTSNSPDLFEKRPTSTSN